MSKKTSQHSDQDAFTAVAHPVRRQILDYLREEPLTVSELATAFEISRPAVSQHLKVLLDAGLVNVETQGRENFYRLHPQRLQDIYLWLKPYEDLLEDKLDALGNFLDNMDEKA